MPPKKENRQEPVQEKIQQRKGRKRPDEKEINDQTEKLSIADEEIENGTESETENDSTEQTIAPGIQKPLQIVLLKYIPSAVIRLSILSLTA